MSIKIFSIYFPGGRSSAATYKSDLRKLLSLPGNYILGGDYNSRHRNWNCLRANTFGNVLVEMTYSFPCNVLYSPNPTYIPASSKANPSTLDLILTNTTSIVSQPVVINELSSDLLPISFHIHLNATINSNCKRNYNKTNWHRFQVLVKKSFKNCSQIETANSSKQIDDYIEVFCSNIQNAIASSTPYFRPKTASSPLPPYLIDLCRLRNHYRRQWSKYRWEYDRLLWCKYNGIIRDQFIRYRNQKWNNMVGNLSKSSKPFWNIAKILRKKSAPIPALKKNDQFLVLNSDKADALATEFVANHKVSQNLGTSSFSDYVSRQVNDFNSANVVVNGNDLVNLNDVKSIIKGFKLRKASGFDQIKNSALKKLPAVALKFLTVIMKSCLLNQYFPDAWKSAKVIAILKPGKPSDDAKNYRPISLLSSLSKILEKIIKTKMWAFIDENNIIPDEQFGFRPCHSTTHQVARLHKHIKENFVSQKSTALVLLDVEKAFDTVWHDGLIFKLIEYNFPPILVKLVKSFITERSFQVSINGELSISTSIPAGVPQGSVLGPLLYIIFTSDIPLNTSCHYALYADDTGIFSTNVLSNVVLRDLQSGLDSLSTYFNKWKIKINAEKTQAIYFTRKRKTCFLPATKLKINGIETPCLTQVKYLGVIFDSKLTYSSHILNIISKYNIAIKMLYPLINRKSDLCHDNKIVLVKVIFQALILYACPAWGMCAKTFIKKLQICQNKLLKMVLNLPWFHSTLELHSMSNVQLVYDAIRNRSERFRAKCEYSDNRLIREIFPEYT